MLDQSNKEIDKQLNDREVPVCLFYNGATIKI